MMTHFLYDCAGAASGTQHHRLRDRPDSAARAGTIVGGALGISLSSFQQGRQLDRRAIVIAHISCGDPFGALGSPVWFRWSF
jgi:hypothetical protein